MTGFSILDSTRFIESTIAPAIVRFSQPAREMEAANISFENRFDTFVSDEPLYAHFLKQTSADHPMREKIIEFSNTNLEAILKYLTDKIPQGKRIWYQKHMVHHILPEMDSVWIENLVNCFLIRNPKAC